MSRPITIKPHLTPEALDAHFASAEGVLRNHLLVIRLARQGRHSAEICEITGFCRDWLFEIIRRYNASGLKGLGDPRKYNKGRPKKVSAELESELKSALLGQAPDGGPWTSRKVANWLEERLGEPVSMNHAWRTLTRLGFSLQRPRPRHAAAEQAEQEDFKRRGLQGRD